MHQLHRVPFEKHQHKLPLKQDQMATGPSVATTALNLHNDVSLKQLGTIKYHHLAHGQDRYIYTVSGLEYQPNDKRRGE
jgi:hypothetical protein